MPSLAGQSTDSGEGPANSEQPASQQASALAANESSAAQAQNPPRETTIRGRIIDPAMVPVVGAKVELLRDDQSAKQETVSGDDGQFAFVNAAPGAFRLSISSAGFATREVSGNLRAGESYAVPEVVLAIASVVTEVRVIPLHIEIAQEQIKEEEKQRALGVIPNFYVTYEPDAVSLTSKQKFELAWKSMVDPTAFGLTAIVAGVQQAQNDFKGYGQGAQGYAKRFGAAYADGSIDTFIGSAVLPSLLRQDPRYFYKGTGSKRSRILYAVANAVICRGDNGHWQPNYSGILGGLVAGGISNLYYPAQNRDGLELTFENTLIGIGVTAATNILQEFVIKKLTPNVPKTPNNSLGKDPGDAVRSPGF